MNAPNVKHFNLWDDAFDYSVILEQEGYEPQVIEAETIGGYLVIWF